jgi:hypothetical protein
MSIKRNEIKIHTESEKSGVFELELEKTEITETEQEINIMLDKSGSMDDECGDGNSKMSQIKHVTKNILRYIAANCKKENISVSVSAFNTSVETIINNVTVSDKNLSELITQIGTIYPEDGTNIESSLKAMQKDIHLKKINNIFMSDGDANDGETMPTKLAKLVDTNASNTFVGFGLEHNPQIFAALSETENSSYYFIDKIEKSGMAYGEILHGILYRSLSNVRITIKNGLIYDWRTNEWLTDIFVGNMSGEMKKMFNIKTETASEIEITVCGNNINDNGAEVKSVSVFTGETENLTRMIYRQRTQEILYKAKQVNINASNSDISAMKKEMNDFMVEMKEYMKTNEMADDKLMKNLCDDIAIVYRTLGTIYGQMYSYARQTSQGSERLHNVSDTPRPVRLFGNMTPSKPKNIFGFSVDVDDDAMDEHTISDELSTPYYSEEVATVMRLVSEVPDDE